MARRLGIPVRSRVSALVVASAAQATDADYVWHAAERTSTPATNGEVLQLPPGPCATNLTVNNPASFTLEEHVAGQTLSLGFEHADRGPAGKPAKRRAVLHHSPISRLPA